MITLALNALSSFLFDKDKMNLSFGKNLELLKCKIVEINEQQDYGIPDAPVDNGTYINDTIFKLPLRLNVRVFVLKDDMETFENNLKQYQLKDEFFTINSMNNKTYKNMKLVSYARDLNNTIVYSTFYNLAFKEFVLVNALVDNYKNKSNAGYGKNQNLGNKNPQKIEKSSAAYKGLKGLL